MIAEGQAEPWEAVTTPPSPAGRAMYSCQPEDLIRNYSQAMRWAEGETFVLDGYLFWGAEYWLLRDRDVRVVVELDVLLEHVRPDAALQGAVPVDLRCRGLSAGIRRGDQAQPGSPDREGQLQAPRAGAGAARCADGGRGQAGL